MRKEDIDPLISLLQMLKTEPGQHFHLSSDYKAAGGVGDITISIQEIGVADNMERLGKAKAPGEEIDQDS